jgi:5-methylcytosine-specific restriction endonuclease McrA
MSEYVRHLFISVENNELTADEAYKILYPTSEKTILKGVVLGNKHKCWYCGSTSTTVMTKDHFWPKSKGGKLMVYCCVRCNTQKGSKTPLQWARYIETHLQKGFISHEKGNRMITATLSLWENLERKIS